MAAVLCAGFGSAEELDRGQATAAEMDCQIEQVRRPVPPHAPGPSPVRRWVLVGGVVGFASGWALTIGTALAWPLRVGGKPIVSWPAFFVIAFELTILFAALTGLLGFLRHARLPAGVPTDYTPEAAVDRFELRVRCAPDQAAALREALGACGAQVAEEDH